MRILSIFICTALCCFGATNKCLEYKNNPTLIVKEQNSPAFEKCKEELFDDELLKELFDVAYKIRGDEIDCDGMGVLDYKKAFENSVYFMLFAPQEYKDAKALFVDDERAYLEYWSYRSFYNYELYLKFNNLYKEAISKFKSHFVTNFGYDNKRADFLAEFIGAKFIDYIAGQSALGYGFSAVEELVLDKNIDIDELKSLLLSKNISNLDLTNALFIAILQNREIGFLNFLIESGARINLGDENSLFFALKNRAILEFLLSKGANINYQNSFGKSAIFYAVELKDSDLVSFLIENGANVNAKYISESEKLAKTMSGNTPFYIKFCALNHTSKTLLMHAAHHSNLEIVKQLIAHKANINAVDDMGLNALDYAILGNNEDIATYLKANGLKKQNLGEYYE